MFTQKQCTYFPKRNSARNLVCAGGKDSSEKTNMQLIFNKSNTIAKFIIKDCHEKGASFGKSIP